MNNIKKEEAVKVLLTRNGRSEWNGQIIGATVEKVLRT
jgi:hypothetical protein